MVKVSEQRSKKKKKIIKKTMRVAGQVCSFKYQFEDSFEFAVELYRDLRPKRAPFLNFTILLVQKYYDLKVFVIDAYAVFFFFLSTCLVFFSSFIMFF